MTIELIRAFFLIFVAEMGDKTQIIAMTFATQYKVKEVLAGVFLGVFLNHGLAIVLGRYISRLVPMDWIQLMAGIMFVIFGLLALKEEQGEDNKNKKSFGPIITVALAFFIGELGDKTQLTAMTLATEGSYPLFILAGTILGMIATSGLGILIGSKIGERIPDIFIKIISSLIFVFFGTLKLYRWIPTEFSNFHYGIIYFITIIFIQIFLIRRLIFARRYVGTSPMKEVAATLYIQTTILNNAIKDICLGEEECGSCSGGSCIIGYVQNILKNARDNGEYYIEESRDFNKLIDKDFDKNKVLEALGLIITDYMKYGIVEDEGFIINQIRGYLELILFGRRLKFDGNVNKYIKQVKKINSKLGEKLKYKINGKY